MAKALRQIREKEVLCDLFIVVLDARAPISTYNSEFDKIAPKKPRLFVITKDDLSDKSKLPALLTRFNHESDKAIVVNLKSSQAKKKILDAANLLLLPKKTEDLKKGLTKARLRALVIGVPNSGKSTLINLLASQAKTKVGNMPGVTRGQQWVNAGEIQLLDTPGILWPKFEDELIGVKLAIIGSIKMQIIPPQELFFAGYKLLSKYYPEHVQKLGLIPSEDEKIIYTNLFTLCEKKQFVKKGNLPDTDKAMKWFATYLRDLPGVTYD